MTESSAVAYISLDPVRREINIYPKNISQRIEKKYQEYLTNSQINQHDICILGKDFFNYEIGTAHTVKIRDIVILIKKLAKNSHTYLNFGALPYRKNEVMESYADIYEIQKLGWESAFSLEEGLKKTIDLEMEALSI